MQVEVRNVSHEYGTTPVLDDVSVTFQRNRITAILGRSGSGKSTLLKVVNGLIRPTRGSVSFSGAAWPGEWHHRRRKMGYLVQGSGLFPHLSVRNNIELPARIAGEPVTEGRSIQLLELTGLNASYSARYAHELSGGEQQRVAICRALYLKPSLLLMDEPFGALDPLTRKEINEKILELHSIEPVTIVVVTHDVAEARRLASRAVIIEKGKIIQDDAMETIIKSPANKHVADFVNTALI